MPVCGDEGRKMRRQNLGFFEAVVVGGVYDVLVGEEAFLGDGVLAETGEGATRAEFQPGGGKEDDLQAVLLLDAGEGVGDSVYFLVFRFVLVFEVEAVLAAGAGVGELGHDFAAVSGTGGPVAGREVAEPVVVGHEVEARGDGAFDSGVHAFLVGGAGVFAESGGVVRDVAVAVSAVDDGGGEPGESAETEAVDGGDGAVVADGGLAEEVEGAESRLVGDAGECAAAAVVVELLVGLAADGERRGEVVVEEV